MSSLRKLVMHRAQTTIHKCNTAYHVDTMKIPALALGIMHFIIPPHDFLFADWYRAGHMIRYRISYQEIVPNNGR